MQIYGYPINYDGDFGTVPVIQAGRYQLIHIKDYPAVPLKLGMHLIKAKQTGAQFLIIDPDPVREDYPLFVNIAA